jgi:hypothetical protein
MLADPYSKKRPRNYTDDEFQAALALLIDDNEHGHKKRKPEYWSDSDNDDWPKYDHNNEHPYDPTLKLLTPNEQAHIDNLQQPTKETSKQQQPLSKPLRSAGNVPATNMERLNYAIASRKNKPRAYSIGGRKTKRKPKRPTKSGCSTNKTKRAAKRAAKRTAKRPTKSGCSTNTAKRKKGGSGKEKIPITKDGLYLLPGTGPNDHVVKVEDPTAPQGHINNMAKVRGTGTTPVYHPETGLFK